MPPMPMSKESAEIEGFEAVFICASVILPIMARSSPEMDHLTFPWWQGSGYALQYLKEFS
jgi:hypothetical protein